MKAIRLLVITSLAFLVFGSVFAQDDNQPQITFEEALACVQEVFPASEYFTNDYLPTNTTLEDIGPTPSGYEITYALRVGMPWVLNDEEAPFYNALELGYFTDEGLEVELVPGGPGIDHLLTLAGGIVDIAVVAGAQTIPSAVNSETSLDVTAVGTILKGMPYTYMTILEDLQDKELTPEDLVGKVIATQPGAELYTYMLLDKYGIPRDSVTFIDGGFSAESLLVNQIDPNSGAHFFTGWKMNQPRQLEEAGYAWNGLEYRNWVYNEYSDTIAVRGETLETPEGQDMVRRFLRATYRGTQYLVNNPEHSAEIATKYSVDVPVTKEQALWRFENQLDLVLGDTPRLLEMNAEHWNTMTATLVQYDQMELDCPD